MFQLGDIPHQLIARSKSVLADQGKINEVVGEKNDQGRDWNDTSANATIEDETNEREKVKRLSLALPKALLLSLPLSIHLFLFHHCTSPHPLNYFSYTLTHTIKLTITLARTVDSLFISYHNTRPLPLDPLLSRPTVSPCHFRLFVVG